MCVFCLCERRCVYVRLCVRLHAYALHVHVSLNGFTFIFAESARVYTCMSLHVYVYVFWVRVNVYVSTYICLYVRLHAYVLYVHVSVYVFTFIYGVCASLYIRPSGLRASIRNGQGILMGAQVLMGAQARRSIGSGV